MDDLISEFIYSIKKHSLGPENGTDEVIEERPDRKYFTGILFPQYEGMLEVKVEDNSPDSEDSRSEDVTEDETVKSKDFSISSAGISFSCKSDRIKVLLTYGRYSINEIKKYVRMPFYKSLDIVLKEGVEDFTIQEDEVIIVKVKTIREDKNVKVMVISELKDANSNIEYDYKWKYALYQVSLRVNTYHSLIGMNPNKFVEDRMSAVYSDKRAFGIGQTCTAIWKDLDIESEKDSKTERLLKWPDYSDQFDEFYSPDIRTEFVPLYQSLTPESVRLDADLSASEMVGKDYSVTLNALVTSYESWILGVKAEIKERKGTIKPELYAELLKNIANNEDVLERIRKGIEVINKNKIAEKSFQFVNAVMDKVGQWRKYDGNFEWRPFQLAFLLMEIYDIVNKESETRNAMDVIWVHTGAGKTEAYLSVAVFDIIYRRYVMQSRNEYDKNPGTSVISRYTLRLLTVQQFKRTMEVIAAAEFVRRKGYKDLDFFDGSEYQISSGIWVGNNLTPNTRAEAIKYIKNITQYSSEGYISSGNPAQIMKCPSCGSFLAIPRDEKLKMEDSYYIEAPRANIQKTVTGNDFEISPVGNKIFKLTAKRDMSFRNVTDSIDLIDLRIENSYKILLPGYNITDGRPRKIEINCHNPQCELGSFGIKIPAYTVDEDIYKFHPSFVISTVDKIARLSFSEKASKILRSEDAVGPDLIIQDEMHLLNGPLGSLFGMYENAVSLILNDKDVKYIAASATINRFEKQVGSLFSRKAILFPPGGIFSSDSYYFKAKEPKSNKINPLSPGRVYMGLTTTSTSLQSALVNVISEIINNKYKHMNHKDIKYFWTPVLYFNSLKELSVASSLYREDIMQRIKFLTSLELDPENLQELSSRASSTEIPVILDGLERWNDDPVQNPDALITTSMFGTGVDISRFSLMVVSGQPKMTAEYIQATGRTGRKRNSLVIVLYNISKPRDKSHYEMFLQYHDQIQANVESSPVSPWSSGSLDMAGGPAFVAYARAIFKNLAEQNDAINIRDNIEVKEQFLRLTRERIKSYTKDTDKILKDYGEIIEKWYNTARDVDDLKYNRFSNIYKKSADQPDGIVLGSPEDRYGSRRPEIVYENAPQSLRDIEETGSFDNVDIRRSQFVFGYGPGSIIEGRTRSSAIQRNSIYKINRSDKGEILKSFDITGRIPQSIIQSVSNFVNISERIGSEGIRILELPSDQALQNSKSFSHSSASESLYETSYFPLWRICLNDNKHHMKSGITMSVLYKSNDAKDSCPECGSNRFSSQIRFVMACQQGHLDDVDWNYAVGKNRSKTDHFYLHMGGTSLESMKVIHPKTGNSVTMRDIYSMPFRCTGRYVEIAGKSTEEADCEYSMKVLQRQASSLRYPESFMYLNIPEKDTFVINPSDQEYILRILRNIDDKEYDDKDVKSFDDSIKNILGTVTYNELKKVFDTGTVEGLRGFKRAYTPNTTLDVSVETIFSGEFKYLYDLLETGHDEENRRGSFSPSGKGFFDFIEDFRYGSIERVETLIIQTGYIRNVRSGTANADKPQRVMSSFGYEGKYYLPGIINRGDAIFIYLRPKDIRRVMDKYLSGEEEWDSINFKNDDKWQKYKISSTFVFLHTLSHALIKEISNITGYSITSLRERVYNTPAGCGILIYTTGSGSDGSIGGLTDIANGGTLRNILKESIDHYIKSCSNDPFCSSKSINIENQNGAACYSCIMLPETSCEYGNRSLSRKVWRVE